MDRKILKEYVSQLSPVEKIALQIAIKQLGTSFDIHRSIGFLSWMEKRKENEGEG
jgi:hypothetical protein